MRITAGVDTAYTKRHTVCKNGATPIHESGGTSLHLVDIP